MDLLTIVTTEKTISVRDAICNALQGLTANEQLSKLVDFFQVVAERDAQLTELIAEAWDYLNANTLWNARYSSLEALKQDIDYDYALRHILDRHQANVGRRKGEIRTILDNWGLSPDAALPSDLQPPVFSERILRNLATLSKICTLETAIPLLHLAVQARRSTPGLLKHEYLHQGDVLTVIKRLKTNTRLQTLKPSSQLRIKAQPVIRRVEDNENGDEKDEEDEEDEEGDGGEGEEEQEEDDCIETLPVPDHDDRQGFNPINAQKMTASSTQSTPTASSKPTASSRGCICPPKVAETLLSLQDNFDDKAGLQVLRLACNTGLETMCRRHLRTLSSTSVGLHNNHSGLVLRGRIIKVLKHASNLSAFKVKHHDWFSKPRRPPVTSDKLAVYRYAPVTQPEFCFNETKVFERFAGAGAWQVWQRDGTMVIDGVFNYLDREDMKRSIDVEFAIYRHHHRNLSGRSRLGWLRNMFYSLIQQLVRQDPVWYAIIASARPDKNWRLITYPYITKDTDAGGETTGFLHLDLNTSKFVQDGSGGNLLSSSMSLDDEESDGCTVVVPGFHRHIKEWHARRLGRGEDPAGFTTNCSTSYRTEDRRDWGEPEPAPCLAFGIRVTRPEIIHGSTPFSIRRRRTLNPWYSGIHENHEDLEVHGTLSWSELAACHRDLEAPAREPSGQTPRYGLPGFRFPGSIVTESSSALGDALVGRRKWTDSQTCKERDILLGDNDERARAYVTAVREKLIAKYREAYGYLEEMERKFFGEHSYFYCQEHGLETDGEDTEGTLTTDDEEGNMDIGDDGDNKGVEEEENGNDDVEMEN